MRGYARGVLVTTALGLAAVMCGGGSTGQPCVSGQSIACFGTGGCSGYQVCNGLGSYDPCDCAGADGSAGADAAEEPSADTGLDDGAPDEGTTDALADAAPADAAPEASIDAGNWTPTNLTGLVLWLDDTVGIVQDPQKTGYVRRWLDQSGKGNNADVTNYQTYEPSIDPAVLNGHDAVAYQSTFGCLLPPSSTDFQFGTGDFMIAAVVKLATPNQTPGHFLWNGSSTGANVYQDESNNITLLAAGNEVVVHNNDISKFHIVVATGAALGLRVDAQSATGVTNTTNLTAMTGCIMAVTSSLSGTNEIAEAIVVKGTVPSGDVTNLQQYWKTKFNL